MSPLHNPTCTLSSRDRFAQHFNLPRISKTRPRLDVTSTRPLIITGLVEIELAGQEDIEHPRHAAQRHSAQLGSVPVAGKSARTAKAG